MLRKSSDLDFENAITINGVTVPSLTTRRAGTSIELGNGESFVIGGLVSQSVMKNVNKIPGLGEHYTCSLAQGISLSRDKELLFIVTPRLVRPLAEGAVLGPMPGERQGQLQPRLWGTLLLSDDDENARYTGCQIKARGGLIMEHRFIVVTEQETRFAETAKLCRTWGLLSGCTGMPMCWPSWLVSLGTNIVFVEFSGDNTQKAGELASNLLSVYPRLWIVGFASRVPTMD